MIKNIRHTGIVIENIEESVSFYRDLLGFEIRTQMEESGDYINNMLDLENVQVTTIKMGLPSGGPMIELLYFSSHPKGKIIKSLCDIGPTHIALTVENLDELKELLKKQNIPFLSEPQYSPDGKVKLAFCQAPEGTYLELVEEL